MPDNIVTIDFRRHLALEQGDTLLDLGSGNGRHTIEACRWPVRVVSVDVDRDELMRARFFLRAPEGGNPFQLYSKQYKSGFSGWADFVVADAQHLPFKDGAFTKVMCTEVMEHIPNDKQGIGELYRVANPGAAVAVSVPRYWPERMFWTLSWEYWHTPGGHIRMYKPGQMATYLAQQGFNIEKTRYRHSFQTLYWFLRCTFGKDAEERLPTKLMGKFINWYHGRRNRLLERVEAAANLIAGKDMVIYTHKPASVPSPDGRTVETEARVGG